MTKRQAKVQLTASNPEAESDPSDSEVSSNTIDKSTRKILKPLSSSQNSTSFNPFRNLGTLNLLNDQLSMMSSLNESFAKAVHAALKKNPTVDLSSTLFPQYNKHLEKVKETNGSSTHEKNPSLLVPSNKVVMSADTKTDSIQSLSNIPPFNSLKADSSSLESKSFLSTGLDLTGLNSSKTNAFSENTINPKPDSLFKSAFDTKKIIMDTTSSVKNLESKQLEDKSSLCKSDVFPRYDDKIFPFTSNSDLSSVKYAPTGSDSKNQKLSFSSTDKGSSLFEAPASIFAKQTSSLTFPKASTEELRPFSFLPKENVAFKGFGFMQSELHTLNSNHSLEAQSASDDQEENDELAIRKPDDDPLLKTGKGEEDEDCLCEERSKLYVKVGEGWTELGIGIFKLNRNRENKKIRLLFRVEGSGKILLNSWMQGVAVQVKNKDLFMMIPDANLNRPTQYLLRCSSQENASNICTLFNSS